MSVNTGLSSFNTVMHSYCQCIFTQLWLDCPNIIVGVIRIVCVSDVCLCVSVSDFFFVFFALCLFVSVSSYWPYCLIVIYAIIVGL